MMSQYSLNILLLRVPQNIFSYIYQLFTFLLLWFSYLIHNSRGESWLFLATWFDLKISPIFYLVTSFKSVLSCLILRRKKKIRNLILTRTNCFICSWLFQPTLNLLLQSFNKVQSGGIFQMWQDNNNVLKFWVRQGQKGGKSLGQRNWGKVKL